MLSRRNVNNSIFGTNKFGEFNRSLLDDLQGLGVIKNCGLLRLEGSKLGSLRLIDSWSGEFGESGEDKKNLKKFKNRWKFWNFLALVPIKGFKPNSMPDLFQFSVFPDLNTA